MDNDSFKSAFITVGVGRGPWLAVAAADAAKREERIANVTRFVAAGGRSVAESVVEARRAVKLAEHAGLEAGRASTAPTSAVVERYIDTLEWLAARGEPLPQDGEAMRAAFKQYAARDLFASLGVAFPYT